MRNISKESPVSKIPPSLVFAFAALLSLGAAQAADDLTRPIRVSPNGHFLVQPDGEPFFWLADTAWELFHRLTREESDEYLKARAAKGFTVIQAAATGRLYVSANKESGVKALNRYGHSPFIEADPLRPDPEYFQHIDWVVERAAHYGLRIALLPA